MKWDARWLKLAMTMQSYRMMTFFLIKCTKEGERESYKDYYMNGLKRWYEELGDKEYAYYMNLDTTKRSEYINELICMLTGLSLTGAKEEAISAIPYFVAHLDKIKGTLANNLCQDDLVYIDRLEAGIEQFKDNKRKRIEEFIDYIRGVIKK